MVSTSLLRKILNERVSKLHVLREIVAYTFLNECEKNHRFLSSIKKMHRKENWFRFLPHDVRSAEIRKSNQGRLTPRTRTRQHVRDNKTGRSYRRWTMPSAAICSGCLRASAPHTSESRRSWISSARAAFWRETTLSASCNRDNVTAEHFLRNVLLICVPFGTGGSVAEWLACCIQAQKGLRSNRSRDVDG